MDISIEELETSHRNEIEQYEKQLQNYKDKDIIATDINERLLAETENLKSILKHAKQANQDLEIAFKCLHEENTKLKNQVVDPLPRLEYAKDVDNSRKLEEQLFELIRDRTQWIEERDKINRRSSYLERECNRFKTENMILSKQTQKLIRVIEQERGTIIRSREEVGDVDDRLITYESIEEMQQNNVKALALCKELATRNEELEGSIVGDDVAELKNSIANLTDKLDSVQKEREKQTKTIQDIIQQRDLFKILLSKTRQVEHLTPEIFQRMVSIACSASPAITGSSEICIPQDAINTQQLKDQIESLKEEVDKLLSMYNDQISQNKDIELHYQEIIEESRVNYAKLSCELKECIKKNEILESNTKIAFEECDEFKARCHKVEAELLQQNEFKVALKKAEEENLILRQRSFELEKKIEKLKAIIIKQKKVRQQKPPELLRKEKELNKLRLTLQRSEDARVKLELSVAELEQKLFDTEQKIANFEDKSKKLRKIIIEDRKKREGQVSKNTEKLALLETELEKVKEERSILEQTIEQFREKNRKLTEALISAKKS